MNAVKPILGEVKTSELLDDDDDDDVIVEEEDKQGLHFFISYDQYFSSVICILTYRYLPWYTFVATLV